MDATHELTNPRNEAEKVASHLVSFEEVHPFRAAEMPAELLLEIIQVDTVCH
jgi:hypothetical protein